jgi:hypothetical protein
MTVGGNTIGRATIASIGVLMCERVRASHHANGVPNTISSTVVIAAS